MMNRALRSGDAQSTGIGADEDTIEQSYINLFCDPNDNAGQNETMCTANVPAEQRNADIDYTQTINSKLTLDIDLLDDVETIEETTLFSFMNHIFMHNNFPWASPAKTNLSRFVEPYLDMRSLIAMRSVAKNSMAYIISEKAAGPSDANNSVAPFLKSMMSEMGIGDDEVNEMLGENPSYYAQMEMLTRQIYYHPDFIANLYDKPANVKRMAAAMTAIKSMQNWQISEALKRREMLFSVLLEIKLREQQTALETQDIPDLKNNPAPEPLSNAPNGL
jgi:hypothetical protein